MGNNDLPPKREMGVLRYRDYVGGLEVLCVSGKLSAKAECGATLFITWFQGGEGNGDSNLGGKVGATVSEACV